MAQPERSHVVKIGVLLAQEPDNLGPWLADAAAFEAAGADALVVEFPPEAELDPFALTAALAAVTYRSLLVTSLHAADGASPDRVRMLATISRLSRGRLRILVENAPAGWLADVGPGLGIFRRVSLDPAVFEHTCPPDETERWVSARCPDSRAAWRAALLDIAERSFQGLLVPAEPRLLDMLRSPDDSGQRSDLQLAQG